MLQRRILCNTKGVNNSQIAAKLIIVIVADGMYFYAENIRNCSGSFPQHGSQLIMLIVIQFIRMVIAKGSNSPVDLIKIIAVIFFLFIYTSIYFESISRRLLSYFLV